MNFCAFFEEIYLKIWKETLFALSLHPLNRNRSSILEFHKVSKRSLKYLEIDICFDIL